MVCFIKKCQTMNEILEETPIVTYSPEMTNLACQIIFNSPVLMALKYLRGNSGLDKQYLDVLNDPVMMSLVEVALDWINNNYDNIPTEVNLDFLNIPEEDVLIEENFLYDDWEPEYIDF